MYIYYQLLFMQSVYSAVLSPSVMAETFLSVTGLQRIYNACGKFTSRAKQNTSSVTKGN